MGFLLTGPLYWGLERFMKNARLEDAVLFAGLLVCYLFGTVWFMVIRGTDLMSTLSICVFPFLPFDALKILLAAFLSDRLEKPLEKAAGITH